MRDGVVRLHPTRDVPDKKVLRHIAGLQRPATAKIRPELGVGVYVGVEGEGGFRWVARGPDGLGFPFAENRAAVLRYRAAERRAREVAARQRGGKRPNLGMSMLFGGGPDTDRIRAHESSIGDRWPAKLADGRPWTHAVALEAATVVRDLVREALPREEFAIALHLDEKSWHVQLEMPALTVDADGTERVGNAAIRERFARLAPGFEAANRAQYEKLRAREAAAQRRHEVACERARAAKKRLPKRRGRRWIDHGPDAVYLTHEAQMRLIHDLYADRMEQFGIVRGRGGRKQHHERVDRDAGMRAREESIEFDAMLAAARQVVAADRLREEELGVSERDAQVRARELGLDTRDIRQGARAELLDDRERAAAMLERQAARREGEVADREQAAATLERQAARREGEVADREQAAATLERQAARREGEVADRERAAATLERQAARREGEVADRERAAATLERQAARREGEVADREQAVQEREQAAAALEETANKLRRDVSEFVALCHRLVGAVAERVRDADSRLRDLRTAIARAEKRERRAREGEASARRVWARGAFGLWAEGLAAVRQALRATGRRAVDPDTEPELAQLLDARDVGEPAELVRRVRAVERRYPDPRDVPRAERER